MVAIIGAGITGLVAAWRLKQSGHEVVVLEASDRAGGNIRSVKHGPYLLEVGPNSLQLNDPLFEVLKELKLHKDILKAEKAAKYRYILKKGKYRKLPTGPMSLVFGSTFSLGTKWRIMRESKQPVEEIPHETLDHFARRRLGDELTDYGVYPFISGIYAGDPSKLLVETAFPRLKVWEREFGSLIKGVSHAAKQQKHRGTFSFANGLEHLVHALAHQASDALRLNTRVSQMTVLSDGGYELTLETQRGTNTLQASHVISTIPAHTLAGILSPDNTKAQESLNQVHYPPVSMVHSAYRREDVAHKLDGFGALHNRLEPSNSLGTIFSSTVFKGRCPEDEVLLTTFVGGSIVPHQAMQLDDQLLEGVNEDHRRFLGITGKPIFQRITRWPKAIPQYDEDILPTHALEQPFEAQQLFLGGNWIGGIAVPACIERGKWLAQRVGDLAELK
ncbi:MAG: protoporphyrinogen oxidase [Bacteroidota bacterium]